MNVRAIFSKIDCPRKRLLELNARLVFPDTFRFSATDGLPMCRTAVACGLAESGKAEGTRGVMNAIGADIESISGSTVGSGTPFSISGSTGIARRISGELATGILAAGLGARALKTTAKPTNAATATGVIIVFILRLGDIRENASLFSRGSGGPGLVKTCFSTSLTSRTL